MLYEFTKLRLTEDEFFNLVFMNPSPAWTDKPDEHEFLLSICGRTLKEVVGKVIEKSSFRGHDPTNVFKNIGVVAEGEDKPWFEHHTSISQCFDRAQMGELWIRNLSDYSGGENETCPNGSFYVEDGNHRALVYAMYVKLGKIQYNPVDAIHATSWDLATGILNFRPERAASLEYNGELQDEKRLRNEFQLPIGIQVKTYKRS